MHFIYLDCFSGISGDMLLGALLDGGASFSLLQDSIAELKLGANLSCSKTVIQGISCSALKVESPAAPPLRHLAQIEELIQASPLPLQIKRDSLAVFLKLAKAEAQVHGVDPSNIHFHEIGAVDTLVDVVGTFLCLQDLGIETVYASPLPWANGLLTMSHGRYPLPAPATANLLKGYPCVFTDAKIELVTPTGAALLTQIVNQHPVPPAFTPLTIGYGAGTNIRADGVPNLLRMIHAQASDFSGQRETIAILETELDDLNPEVFTHLYTLFLDHPGVLDFFTTPVFMKKNRPGTLITVLASRDVTDELCQLLMRETGTLGVRYRFQERVVLTRRQETLISPWGPVRIKLAQLSNGDIHKKPEFEDCQAIATKNNLPLLEVYTVIQGLLVNLKF